MRKLIAVFIFLSGFFVSTRVQATHLRAGEITVERLSCTSLTFKITITVYTNTGSPIKFGDGVLDFGDGSNPHITPQIDNTLRPDLGSNIGTVSYSVNHTFSGPGRYIISYLEPNRNGGILNMFNSIETRFYIETVINIDPFLGCDNSPKLLVPPIDKGCTGAAWYHNPGAYDPDGDSLSYELTIPKKEKDLDVNAYFPPNARKFYDIVQINYGTANEAKTGPPTFSINSRTGTLLWDAPGAAGEYNIAFLIKEWRKIAGTWVLLGSVTRDMQIIIDECNNQRPELEVPPDICVEAGTIIDQDIFGTDPDYDSVKIEAYSQIFNLTQGAATFSPSPAKFQKTAPTVKAVGKFHWQTTCDNVKDQPYQVVFKISDKSTSGTSLVQFKTWNIRVVGPAPKWKPPVLDLVNRSANLQWEPYVCQNASVMQIWRRVDQFSFIPPECVTGIPDFLGYTKRGEVPIGTSTYTDKGLATGAQYCYRLVAIFPLPFGGESYVSQEVCIPPIKADAPVVTNVTVDKTDSKNGQITVKWRPPFEADPVQFPPPYTYQVYRAEGFSGNIKLAPAFAGSKPDTIWVDTGLNTDETTFNYRVFCFDKNGVKLDTSEVASQVRLETKPQFKRIELNWEAVVPWSINTQTFPYHLIYRGKSGDTESQLVLIDSVNVNEKFFHYIDSGQYKNTPLKDTETYCYRVMTRGAYGNARIKEPLINYSQISCAQPNDTVPPCKAELSIKGTSCDEYIQTASCNPLLFSNVITWKKPKDDACRLDTKSYNIYVAGHTGEEFTEYATNVRDTFFIDSNLPSYARCYKVQAVDRAGNKSDLSEAYCFDNCPHYELPNVFTPNGDNCNDFFSAYSDRDKVDENGNGRCGKIDVVEQRKKCARFVLDVEFSIYNRWGKEVFTYKSGSEKSIYIDWDGRDNNGKELSTGTYYYLAKVTFDVVDPSKQNQTIKGWVQLIR